MEYIIKKVPEDFFVQESAYCQFVSQNNKNEFDLYILQKKGITTFVAIECISQFFKIPMEEIGYAGLKDEDAVTSQFITIPQYCFLKTNCIQKFNEKYNTNQSFIRMIHYGYSSRPIQVGRLVGNTFSIMVRNIERSFYSEYKDLKSYNLYFPNYYDTQRFGFPDSLKRTHEIGFNLIRKNYDDARKIIELIDLSEKIRSQNFIGTSKEFFDSIEPRRVSFYYNAWESSIFNQQLSKLIKMYDDNPITNIYDGISYTFSKDKKVLIDILNNTEYLHIVRHYFEQKTIKQRVSERMSVVNTKINFIKWEQDTVYEGKYMVRLSFFLPSGSYATMAIKQLMINLMGTI